MSPPGRPGNKGCWCSPPLDLLVLVVLSTLDLLVLVVVLLYGAVNMVGRAGSGTLSSLTSTLAGRCLVFWGGYSVKGFSLLHRIFWVCAWDERIELAL